MPDDVSDARHTGMMVVGMAVIVGVIEIALIIVVMLELAIMCMLMNRLFCCRLCHFMRMMVVFVVMVMVVIYMVVIVFMMMVMMMIMPLQINIYTLLLFPMDRHFHMRPGNPALY